MRICDIEHFNSDVPIKCDLELQKEVTISPELFEPSDKDQGRDRTEPGFQKFEIHRYIWNEGAKISLEKRTWCYRTIGNIGSRTQCRFICWRWEIYYRRMGKSKGFTDWQRLLSKLQVRKIRFRRVLWKILSLAIKSCDIANEDESKNLLLIQDFCETGESAPIVRKNPDGKS